MTDWQLYDNAGDRRLAPGTVCCYCRKDLTAEAQYALWHPAVGFYYACVMCARGRSKER